jgi:hypothetical protein
MGTATSRREGSCGICSPDGVDPSGTSSDLLLDDGTLGDARELSTWDSSGVRGSIVGGVPGLFKLVSLQSIRARSHEHGFEERFEFILKFREASILESWSVQRSNTC